MNIPDILPIWQPQGHSTHIISKKVAEKYGVKTSHTGTLDPMAEGVIIVLTGETRHKKYEFASWEKEYTFEIAFSIATDSYDGLGLVTDKDFSREKVQFSQVQAILEDFENEYEQQVPPYAAIKVKRRPLHWYARNNKLEEIDIPIRRGTIRELKLISLDEKSFENVTTEIMRKIENVTGDLRQEKVMEQWKNLQEQHRKEVVQIATIKVKMTKGLYVRQLAMDICNRLNVLGFVSKLTRTANGIYRLENSASLEETFGENFNENYNFASKT